jgi:general secretion pathway protein L
LHLVSCPRISEGALTWVAACQKDWLLGVVANLQAAHVPLVGIVPQAFPSDTAAVHVSGSPEDAWVTAMDAQGVLSLPLSQAVILLALSQSTRLTAEPAVAAAAEQVFQRTAQVLQAPQWAVERAQMAVSAGLSLAQGEVVASGRGRAWQALVGTLRELAAAPTWQPVRWGLVGLLAVHIVGLNAWAWKQKAALQDKRAQMQQILTQSFPNVKVVVDAPLQMQRELLSLRQAQGQLSGRDFESIYGRFAAVAGTNIAPTAIDFIANEVQLRGVESAAAQLDGWLPRLQYAGLAVRSEAQSLVISHRDALAGSTAIGAGAKP